MGDLEKMFIALNWWPCGSGGPVVPEVLVGPCGHGSPGGPVTLVAPMAMVVVLRVFCFFLIFLGFLWVSLFLVGGGLVGSVGLLGFVGC